METIPILMFTDMRNNTTLLEDNECVRIIIENDECFRLMIENNTKYYIGNSYYLCLGNIEYLVDLAECSINTGTGEVTTTVKHEFIVTIDENRVKIEDENRIVMFENINPTIKNVIGLLNKLMEDGNGRNYRCN